MKTEHDNVVLSPLGQAILHFGCACKHTWRGLVALFHSAFVQNLTVAAVLILWMIFGTGCVGDRTGGAVVWNPLTWGSRAAPAKVDRAGEKRDEAAEQAKAAEVAAITGAHREAAKAGEALAAAGDSRPVKLARRFNANALSLLAQVRPLTAEEGLELRALVADLLSENENTVRSAELRQIRDEAAAAKLGHELTAARDELSRRDAALAKANANLREAYDRENALANQVRNFWFIAGLLAFLWIAGNLLAVGARFVPALAPVSAAINGIAAPALAFAEQRARAGLSRVGQAIATVRTKLPQAADSIVEIFDQHTDADHQRAIGSAASTAPRS